MKKIQKFNLKEFLHYNLIVIKCLGLWPKTDYRSNKWYLFYAIIMGIFFCLTFAITLTGYVFTTANSLEDITNAGYFILAIMSTTKYFFIMKYTKMFRHLVDASIHSTLNVTLNERQNKILCDYMGFWRIVYLGYNYMSVVIFFNYIVQPAFVKESYVLPLRSWYPFDYKKPVIYAVVYVYQTICTLVAIFLNINGGTLAGGLLGYLSAECNVLVDMLKNLKEENSSDGTSLVTPNLHTCVEYHKKIVEYSKMVEAYFSKYLLIQFTSSCVSTALIMTSLTMNANLTMKIWWSMLQTGVWADLYVYCWYGNEVTVKSLKIPYAAFESNWYTASAAFKKDLLFFILRTQKPIKIYAVNFIELSLNTFIGILRTAYSYYMLLRQLSTMED